MAGDTIPRRGFLVGVGLAGTAAAAGVAASSPATAEAPAPNQPSATPGAAAAGNREPEPLLALNEAEHALIVAAVDTIARRVEAGGRLVYVGAGTTGRLAWLDAVECPPTFGTSPDLVHAIVAGAEARTPEFRAPTPTRRR